MDDPEEFDMQAILAEYRKAYQTGNKTRCLQLRDEWKEYKGEDNLHETVFGEP